MPSSTSATDIADQLEDLGELEAMAHDRVMTPTSLTNDHDKVSVRTGTKKNRDHREKKMRWIVFFLVMAVYILFTLAAFLLGGYLFQRSSSSSSEMHRCIHLLRPQSYGDHLNFNDYTMKTPY
jgi:cytochrome c-type biogenesis protein CcmH/NrfG